MFLNRRPKPPARISAPRDRKVLVTGATGYLGREVVKRLAGEGYQVRAYVRRTSHTDFLEKLGVELAYGDIREEAPLRQAAKDMDSIVHMAAALKGSADFVMDCAVAGTENVAKAATRENVARVIYISSLSVYDYLHAADGTVLSEESMLERWGQKRGVYSWAKRRAEDIALANLSAPGPERIILRPSLIFGEGRDPASLVGPRIGRHVISFGRRSKHLKLVHIHDVARAVLLCLEGKSLGGRVFNVSHEDAITVGQYFDSCLRDGRHGNLKLLCVPHFFGIVGVAMLRTLGMLSGRVPDGFNRTRLAYLCRDVKVDSSPFREATGWHPSGPLLEQLRAADKWREGG